MSETIARLNQAIALVAQAEAAGIEIRGVDASPFWTVLDTADPTLCPALAVELGLTTRRLTEPNEESVDYQESFTGVIDGQRVVTIHRIPAAVIDAERAAVAS